MLEFIYEILFRDMGPNVQLAIEPTTMALLAAPAVAKTLGAIGKRWFSKIPNYTRSDEHQSYITELQRRSKEGVFSQGMQRDILSNTSSHAGSVAHLGRQQVMGQSVRQGTENSGAALQAAASIETERVRRIADAARQIALKNQMSKITARDRLGEIGLMETDKHYNRALAEYARKVGSTEDIFGGLGDIASLYGAKNAGWLKKGEAPWNYDKDAARGKVI